jgi:hypothetical protein
MALAAEARLVDGAIVPDAGDDILQDAPRRSMEEHIIGDDGGHVCPRRHVRQLIEAQRIVRAAAERQRQIGAVPKSLGETAKIQRACFIGLLGHTSVPARRSRPEPSDKDAVRQLDWRARR